MDKSFRVDIVGGKFKKVARVFTAENDKHFSAYYVVDLPILDKDAPIVFVDWSARPDRDARYREAITNLLEMGACAGRFDF